MDDSAAVSLEQIRAFLAGSAPVQFAGQGREEVYVWVEKTLVRHQYAGLGKTDKGLVRNYVGRLPAHENICQRRYGRTSPQGPTVRDVGVGPCSAFGHRHYQRPT